MIEKLQAIVLSKIKHSDKANILVVYTRTHGRMAFIASAGGAKTQKIKNVLYQPLSIVEIICDINKTTELQKIRQITPLYVYKDLYFNPLKNAVGVFVADFLNHVLRESSPDINLWQYIVDSLKFLDITNRGIANFHIAFLYSISAFLGVQPDVSAYSPSAIFDMRSGCYSLALPPHNQYIKGNDAMLPMLLDRMNFANFHKYRFSRLDRNRILDLIIKYYDIHIPGVASMKSPDILKILFT